MVYYGNQIVYGNESTAIQVINSPAIPSVVSSQTGHGYCYIVPSRNSDLEIDTWLWVVDHKPYCIYIAEVPEYGDARIVTYTKE